MTDKIDQIISQYPHIWKTRSAFLSWLKGVIRKGWSGHPVKLTYIKEHRKLIPNPNPNGKKPMVFGAECEICHKDHVMSNIECDHKGDDTAQLTQVEHIQTCVEKLLLVTSSDLRLLCKECHATHSLSQKLGVSFEEASIRKKVIAFEKLKVAEQTKVLQEECGYATIGKTKATRSEQYEVFIKGKE